MAIRTDLTADDFILAGEARNLTLEVFAAGYTAASATPVMRDMTGKTLRCEIRKCVNRAEPHRTRGELVAAVGMTDDGITITGTFNTSRGSNTQRVVVHLGLAAWEAVTRAGLCTWGLAEVDGAAPVTLALGTLELFLSPVEPE